jgi:uncharacterized protein (DUF2235 family)
MTDASEVAPERKPRNIVILSDGTGQRGGLYFDEERSNVYKLYRATRVAPDSTIDPDQQVAFYDPGLGTLQTGGTNTERLIRALYNFISQATGLGITHNIIDCYAAIIRLWQPGDRIFLFGFSRGAYTVRCLASVICYCGVPTSDKDGSALRRDPGAAVKIATRAVKSVYHHVSSPLDTKYLGQRTVLAAKFREDYGANQKGSTDTPNAFPHFIGVFDTVASLSNTGSLVLLCLAYTLLHLALSWVLSLFIAPFQFWYWFGWVAVWAVCVVTAAYVYTHLKFTFRLPGYYFWDVIHLTTFRQKFYDQYLNPKVKYARHAISIDERRNDFKRVPWGSKGTDYYAGEYRIDTFQQFWFAGNHVDVGGGYPENESRLSDIALEWMLKHATDPRLGDEKLNVDPDVLHLNGRWDGMQHDETRSSAFRWARKTLRAPVHDAPLHPSVIKRFALDSVQQYDVMAPYRPEALRGHDGLASYYEGLPLPRATCWERIRSRREVFAERVHKRIDTIGIDLMSKIYPRDWNPEAGMGTRKPQITPDSIVSCLGLVLAAFFGGAAFWILLLWQIVPWLREGVWHSYPLSWLCTIHTDWIGLQLILDWIWRLPVTLLLALLAIAVFWVFGMIAAKMYQWASRGSVAPVTPTQTQAGAKAQP